MSELEAARSLRKLFIVCGAGYGIVILLPVIGNNRYIPRLYKWSGRFLRMFRSSRALKAE